MQAIKKTLMIRILTLIFFLPTIAFSMVNNHINAESVSNLEYNSYSSYYNEDDNDSDLLSQELEQYAENLLLQVKTSNRFVGILATDVAHDLPVGIRKDIAGFEYIIVLDQLSVDKDGATLKAFMTLQFPGSDTKLGFYADNVRIGPEGIESAQLKLIRDKELKMGSFSLVFDSEITMVEWDCNGYSSTTIGGEVIFPSNLIKPIDGNTNDSIVMGGFFASFSDLNDVLLNFNMAPFEINGLPDFEFHPNNVYIDLSDLRNPEQAVFPAGFFPSGQPISLNNLWRGVYIPEFSIKIPSGLGTDNLTLAAQNMFIDANGITGRLHAANVLALDQGNLGGWEFSIDTLAFNVFKNSFSGFKLNGEIKIPISDDQKGFAYSGLLDSEGNLTFIISQDAQFQANLWGLS